MLKRKLSQEIEQKIRKSLLAYAIYRPESALVIAMTLIFASLSLLNLAWFPGEWWLWLLFGLIGEALIVLTTLRDDKFYQRLLDDILKQTFDISKLRSPALQQKLAKALEYHELIVKEIQRKEDTVLDDYLLNMAHGLEDWIQQIYHLSQGLDTYTNDPIIARDMQNVPQELEQFKQLLAQETQPTVQAELQKTIALKQAQLDTLQNLRDTMARAQLQLENTLSSMGVIYTQIIQLGSREANQHRLQRLQQDMTEQVRALEDMSAALDEIYQTTE
jgi:hypothetical protein